MSSLFFIQKLNSQWSNFEDLIMWVLYRDEKTNSQWSNLEDFIIRILNFWDIMLKLSIKQLRGFHNWSSRFCQIKLNPAMKQLGVSHIVSSQWWHKLTLNEAIWRISWYEFTNFSYKAETLDEATWRIS